MYKDQEIGSCNGNSIPAMPSIFLALSAVLFSILIPLYISGSRLFSPMAIAAYFLCGTVAVFISRRLITLIVVGLVFSFSAPILHEIGAVSIVVGAILSSGIIASLIAGSRKAGLVLPALIPVISYALSLILTHSPITALSSLLLLLPSVAMGAFTRIKKEGKTSITAFAFILFAEMLAIAILAVVLFYSPVSQQSVKAFALEMRNTVSLSIEKAVIRAGKVEINAYIARQISSLADLTVNLAAGICAMLSLLIGFAAHKTKCAVIELYELEEIADADRRDIKARVTSGVIFILSYLMTFTSGASGQSSFLGVAAQNICLVFLPILFLSGGKALLRLPRRLGILAVIAWIAVILFASISGSSVITVISLVGALTVLISGIDKWAEQHYSKGEEK